MTVIPTVLRPGSDPLNLTWDMDNRLSSADVDNDSVADVSYQFDALGRRVARNDGTTTTVFVQSGQQTIADYTSSTAASSPTYTYYYASYIDEPVMRAGTGSLRYFQRTQQYSITALTDSNANVTERYAYTAYGIPAILDAAGATLTTSADNNRYLYTGREWDDELGLYHYRARMYDASSGRFLSRDPIGYLDGSNLLSNYFFLEGSDPYGLQKQGNKKSAKCAAAYTKCKALRDIWNTEGKSFTVSLFDIFLAKKGCGKAVFAAETLQPGITATIVGDPTFTDAIKGKLSQVKCGSKTAKFTALPEFLPIWEVINGPGGGNPLIDLDDHQYAIGTVAVSVTGTVTSTRVVRKTQTVGDQNVTCSCCTNTLANKFTASDRFSFHDDFFREVPNPSLNQFSAYYRACNTLQTECGHCAPKWTFSGSGSVSAQSCSNYSVSIRPGPKF